ncbi:(E)-beta-ocimene synthase, chloroplastic-like protein [Tanacetum coccineum]
MAEKYTLARKSRIIRDRLMECFFWSIGIVFEPQYCSCRVGITKVGALVTTIDDIYDEYGSLDELKVFTKAIKRCDINLAEHMPKKLHICFLAIYNTINEMGYNALVSQGENIIPVLQKVIKKEERVFLEEHHDLLKWSSMVFPLCNELATSSDETERGKTAKSITCYMHDTGLCEEVARGQRGSCKKMTKVQTTSWLIRYPRVYALNYKDGSLVADKMEQVDLGSSLRRMPRDGVELMQFIRAKDVS